MERIGRVTAVDRRIFGYEDGVSYFHSAEIYALPRLFVTLCDREVGLSRERLREGNNERYDRVTAGVVLTGEDNSVRSGLVVGSSFVFHVFSRASKDRFCAVGDNAWFHRQMEHIGRVTAVDRRIFGYDCGVSYAYRTEVISLPYLLCAGYYRVARDDTHYRTDIHHQSNDRVATEIVNSLQPD